MKILICGGRDYSDKDKMFSILNKAHEHYKFTLVIEGGAKGADYWGQAWAKSKNIPIQTYVADWKTYGKSAGAIRNQEMLTHGKPDIIIAFPGNSGTQDMIRRGENAGIPVIKVKRKQLILTL